MSSRSVRGRLDRLGSPTAAADGPVCRYHGQACQLGARWPLPYEPDPADDVMDLYIDARRRCGSPVPEHRRDLWAVQRHEQVPDAELREQARELRELIDAQKAKNERILAELLAGREQQWP